ncbi:YlbF family regulator [Microaerobacter geothermalis]|uniref:YlbF family regulator n=1 Tax=Microaerobacter geothermalis TaxID=674972 RepID=UPI001F479AC6|nr:YlbF family regulator [Microaerobacter geothermalis]MCF6094215.1 YlbF family regulator [Microaerobacter geothermalis]
MSLDMSTVILEAYHLADLIKSSEEVGNYLYWKKQMDEHEEAQQMIAQFNRLKEKYEEVERFGKYHPDYGRVQQEVYEMRRKLHSIDVVRHFKEAEDALDELLFTVSSTIAHSVSKEIKVPSNNPLYAYGGGCGTGGTGGSHGCGTGGGCGCK